jgi:hypothetical protein
MYSLTFDNPRSSVAWRALLVLLVTLLAHALLLDRVNRGMTYVGSLPDDASPIAARLLPPPMPQPPPPPPRPEPRPRPAPVRPKPAAPPPVVAEAPAPAVIETAPPAVDVAPAPLEDARKPQPAEAAVGAPGPDAVVDADAAVPSAAAEPMPEPVQAAGEMLQFALDNLEQQRAAMPTEARYVYRTTNSELRIATGTTVVDWLLNDEGRYQLRLATTAVGITVLELLSQGHLRPFGLAPVRYVETRVRRPAESAHFDWDGRRITFSARSHERALADGMQDRLSFQIQLMLLGQAQPEWFDQGRQIVMWMAGRDDLLSYRFRSAGHEPTSTGIGVLDAVRLERLVAPGEARVDVWLVPRLGWLPAKLRFTDRLGRVTESVLESIPKS